jgi:dTDP-4-amino-4,6-dideoxygalactose transaminase
MLALLGGAPLRDTPFPSWPIYGAAEEEALLAVLHSGRWFFDEHIQRFEREFAAFQQAEFGIATSSGTTALQVALDAIGIQPGDEVIVPAYTFVATASAVIATGGIPVFADIDPDTYNIDPQSVAEAITEKTRGIIGVHIAGQPCDLDTLGTLAAKHQIYLLEDAAQAHAAAWKGRRVGAIGHLGTFSFQASKNLCAGEGGFIATNDEVLADRAWSVHNCGRSRTGAWYEHPLVGSNYRISEFHAALLLRQLERLEEQAARRTQNALLLTSLLRDIEGIAPLDADERITTHAYHLYIFRYQAESQSGASRDRFVAALCAEGIPCASGYRPLYGEAAFSAHFENYPLQSPYFHGVPDYSSVSCPVTERVCASESVWLTQNMLLGTADDMRDIAAAIRKVLENAKEL